MRAREIDEGNLVGVEALYTLGGLLVIGLIVLVATKVEISIG